MTASERSDCNIGRVDLARAHCVDADAIAGVIHGQRSCQVVHRALGCAVRGDARRTEITPDRTEVDDRPATLWLHHPKRCPAHEEGAADIDTHDPRPLLVGGVLATGPHDHPGRVHEDVEPAMRSDGLADGAVAEPRVGDVADQSPFRRPLSATAWASSRIAVDDHNPGTAARQAGAQWPRPFPMRRPSRSQHDPRKSIEHNLDSSTEERWSLWRPHVVPPNTRSIVRDRTSMGG